MLLSSAAAATDTSATATAAAESDTNVDVANRIDCFTKLLRSIVCTNEYLSHVSQLVSCLLVLFLLLLLAVVVVLEMEMDSGDWLLQE